MLASLHISVDTTYNTVIKVQESAFVQNRVSGTSQKRGKIADRSHERKNRRRNAAKHPNGIVSSLDCSLDSCCCSCP